jgi:hypothetical protein
MGLASTGMLTAHGMTVWWLTRGPKVATVPVVSRAAMTMDLYGHLVDVNLWQAARLVGDTSGTFVPFEEAIENEDDHVPG